MDEERNETQKTLEANDHNVRSVVKEVINEFVSAEQAKAEPAYKAELTEERNRREQLERRVNELIQENERSRSMAEEVERNSSIRDELQRLGVTKVDLGFKAVKDEIYRAEDGRLVAKSDEGEIGMQDYLAKFARENPELLPARITGGSGASGAQRIGATGRIDLDKIKPGMDPEELARVREEISQVISHTFRRT